MSLYLNHFGYLDLTPPPVLAAPFAVGFWARIDNPPQFGDMWSLTNNGSDYFDVFHTDGDINFDCSAGGTSDAPGVSFGGATGWHYILLRAIATNNRRMAVLRPDGTIGHMQSTTNLNPTGIVRAQIGSWINGSGSNFEGAISHYWWSIADVVADGGQMPDWLMYRLAQYGPLSIPSLIPNLVEYLTFEQGFTAAGPSPYLGERASFQKWEFKGFFDPGAGTVAYKIDAEPPKAMRSRASLDEDVRVGIV